MALRQFTNLKWATFSFLLLVCVCLLVWKHTVLERHVIHSVLSATVPSVSTASPLSAEQNTSDLCEPEQPCQYNDRVDLRIIVMTFRRPKSLLTLLNSLDSLELDSQSATLEIWIDRSRRTHIVHQETVRVASQFHWSKGPTRVHVHKRHVGLYGQWINTWRPPDNSDKELAMFFEDDLSVSKYAYRWARAVFRAFGNRTDFAGASLVGYQMPYLSSKPQKRSLRGPKSHTVFMHKCFGWWGFVPKPMHWIYFQVHCINICVYAYFLRPQVSPQTPLPLLLAYNF